ncbi:MAG: hypothetical protein K6U80_16280 [Firmicutes bacterium]|nr:hypothetical protein [Bacillota bacterium]
MRIEVKLPFLGEEIEYCRILRWLVRPGDEVEIDRDLAELEAGEESFLFPSPVDGRVVEILVPEGGVVITDEPLLAIEDYQDGEGR